jgi:hypothetical protein
MVVVHSLHRGANLSIFCCLTPIAAEAMKSDSHIFILPNGARDTTARFAATLVNWLDCIVSGHAVRFPITDSTVFCLFVQLIHHLWAASATHEFLCSLTCSCSSFIPLLFGTHIFGFGFFTSAPLIGSFSGF